MYNRKNLYIRFMGLEKVCEAVDRNIYYGGPEVNALHRETDILIVYEQTGFKQLAKKRTRKKAEGVCSLYELGKGV